MIQTLIRLRIPALCALLAACGGGGDPAPGPLHYHFDEYHIARIAMEERQAVFQAQSDYQIARGEQVKADADLEDNRTKIQVAENERKQAELGQQSAKSKLNNAESSGDLNRINTAKAEQRAAEMKYRAADQKVVALKAKTSWLKKWKRYTEENTYAKEASFELAKAQLAKEKSIQPRGFKFGDYQTQAADRSRRAQRSKALADQEQQKFLAEKRKYEGMKKEAERAAGRGS